MTAEQALSEACGQRDRERFASFVAEGSVVSTWRREADARWRVVPDFFGGGRMAVIDDFRTVQYSRPMRDAEVLELLRDAGVLLESAHGSVPNVAELVAGEKICGRWWSHPASPHLPGDPVSPGLA